MDDQYSPFSSSFYYLDEGIEEYLKQSLFYNSVDLENTIFTAREELARKDEELMHLKILLTNTAKERDEAITKYDELILENMLLLQQQQQQQQPKLQNDQSVLSNGSFLSIEEDQETPFSATHGLCSSDSDENVVSLTQTIDDLIEKIEPRKPLPEKGKFLQAVMESGPLLQTLLVAGPLPQWQHPPPHLSSIDIPPVTLSSPVSALPPSKAAALTRRGLIF